MKMITLAAILALLVGCTPVTPEEAAAKIEHKSHFYSGYIKRNSYEVCIRGMSHLYFENGNNSQAILLLDPQTSRVIPCKEAQQ